jgi:lysophospholipase L1-like esterase
MKGLVLFLVNTFGIVLGFLSQVPSELKIDSSYALLQYYDAELGKRLVNHMDNVQNDEFVIFHYGGSHIQAERPTTVARRKLQNDFGDGGYGMIFNYGAADTYSSMNYSSTYKGTWKFAKSYQNAPKIPLGVCGMAVEGNTLGAELNFKFKTAIPNDEYEIILFTDVDSTLYDFQLTLDTNTYIFHYDENQVRDNAIRFTYSGEITNIQLKLIEGNAFATKFPFYGISIEKVSKGGIVYHSMGVGAAPFKSVLQLAKMPQQAQLLKPDMVFLDFGTNDILYSNSIDSKLADQIRKAIQNFKDVNPDVIIVLTTVQDLYYKGNYITVGPQFCHLIDSIAEEQHCMLWNWYDLSGGLGTIKTWKEMGYAQSDHIHLTDKGYEVKGDWIYKSILNTYNKVKEEAPLSIRIPLKNYDLVSFEKPKTSSSSGGTSVTKTTKTYKVKQGDTLSGIAQKNGTTVAKIKAKNGLKSDMIKIGQTLKIP